MRKSVFAKWLLFIIFAHIGIGMTIFYPTLLEILELGWFNVIGPDFLMGSVVFWFLIFSWPLLLIVVDFYKKESETISTSFGLTCVIGGLMAASLMPLSGFWTLVALGGVSLGCSFKSQHKMNNDGSLA